MLHVAVSNFRGCVRAQLEAAPIALLAGPNAAGKSSIAQAAAAALTGNALPVAGLRSNAAGVLVHTGANSATVEVTTETGSCRLDWPDMRRSSTGRSPEASEYATGLRSIVDLAPKDRLRVLSEYLHAEPTRDDLKAALDAAGLDGAIESVWSAIEQHGWDGAVSLRRERGQQYKGMWRQATGANYGSRVAASWRPDLADLDHSELSQAVNNARNERDRAIAAEAVSSAERRRLEDEADLHDAREGASLRLSKRVSELSAALTKAQHARMALPAAARHDGSPCPWCGMLVRLNQVSLVEMRLEKVEMKLDDAEVKRRGLAIADADGKFAKATTDLAQARREATTAQIAVTASLEARHKLDKWPRAVETGLNRETIEAQLAEAEKRLADYTTKQEADRIHALVQGNEIVIELLAPEGLRAAKLVRVLEVFGADLADLCEAAGWPAVRLDAAGGVAYGDRPYGLASTSEQYRVRAVLAAAMAQIDGSQLLIFDGADILDSASRPGLFSLVDMVEIPALVCATLRREHVPDLAAHGAGQSYWLAGGLVEPLARVAA